MLALPRLYAIADAETLARRGMALDDFARQMGDAGVTLLQYRDKISSPQAVLENAARIREIFSGYDCTLILNDRADLAVLAGWDGLHVGQTDLSPAGARAVIGAAKLLGVSTHNAEQLRAAEASDADYLAIGPVFETETKENPDPAVGLEGVRRARALTKKPLVAIGGITRDNSAAVIAAGADSVAVIAALLPAHPGATAEKSARDILLHLR